MERMWALGDYGRIADLLAGMGRDLVAAAGVRPGQRVLDVAAGTGNAAIPAARAGATVTALDSTAELLAAGRRNAGDLPIEWVSGDAADLPFDDGAFDVVLSCIGAIFVPDHAVAARELLRVCRSGGVLGMANWTADGSAGRFLALLARYGPDAADGPPPTSWGDPAYVRKLLDGASVEARECAVELDFAGTAAELAEIYQTSFPPVIATRAALPTDAARAAFDRDLLRLLTDENLADEGRVGRWRYSWLLVRAAVP